MTMVLTRLKIPIATVHITVLVMIMASTRLKHGWIEVGFMQQYTVFSVMVESPQKSLHQTALRVLKP